MKIRWYGQSAYALDGIARRVVIDPFGDLGGTWPGMLRFAYPPIEGVQADLLLITHEHIDHNNTGAVDGSPALVRSTAGKFQTPIGEVRAIASEHDPVAGTERGPNTIFVFELDGLRVCHMGDFGQSALRPEQIAAIGEIELLFLPVGGGATIDGRAAAQVVSQLRPIWAVPMHYRTEAVDFLEGPEDFMDAFPGTALRQFDESSFDVGGGVDRNGRPSVLMPAAPAPLLV
jgi:L-ascorbate metabolism protein UlaG (beta-lactamase superfamily)